jgi:glycosyltransferase involved in cell wall biosynthesis
MKGLVSIITACYNSEEYIAEAIQSVQAQTYTNWEMLITDDRSSDNTRQIVETYVRQDKRIKLFCLENNQGPAVARNHSIKNAKGRFIAFLDADDIWMPEKLELQTEEMLKNDIAVCYSSYRHVDESGKDLNTTINAIPQLSWGKLLKNNYIGNLTGIYDASKIGKVYHPPLKKRQDWCIWLECLKRSEKPAWGLQQTLAKYRVRQNSISRNKTRLLKYNFQVYHKFLKFGYLKSLLYLLLFLKEYFLIRPKYISRNEVVSE